MATQELELRDPVSLEINQSIDRLILCLEQRRCQLLSDLRNRREEVRGYHRVRQQIETQIKETRAFLEGQMTHNMLHSIQEKMLLDLEAKMSEMQVTTPTHQQLTFQCDTQDLERHISCLGEIVSFNKPDIPPKLETLHCTTFQRPIVAVGKKGAVPGEFNEPKGVSIDTVTGHIYVADGNNRRIQIFSETGDFLTAFGQRHLTNPWGVLVNQNSIYVTDWGLHAVLLFKRHDLTLLKEIGKKGSGNVEFSYPRQPAIAPNQRLYIPDANNNRIQIFSPNLFYKGTLQHPSLTHPADIKFTNTEMFVLSFDDVTCIHVFSLSGEKSRALITRGMGMEVESPHFFCLDKHDNIIISDCFGKSIHVFSPKGDLLKVSDQPQLFLSPEGVAVNNNKLVCVSQNKHFGLQIFDLD